MSEAQQQQLEWVSSLKKDLKDEHPKDYLEIVRDCEVSADKLIEMVMRSSDGGLSARKLILAHGLFLLKLSELEAGTE